MKAISACASSESVVAVDVPPEVPEPAEQAKPGTPVSEPKPADPNFNALQEKYLQYVRELAAYHQYEIDLEKYQKRQAFETSLVLAENRRLAQVVMLIHPARRVAELTGLVKTTRDLQKALRESFGKDGQWGALEQGTPAQDYILIKKEPVDRQTMRDVALTFTPIQFAADDVTGLITQSPGTPVNGKFAVRDYSRFAVEPGVGAVFGTIKAPKYGTGMNSEGKLVIKKAADSTVSVSPSILLNFVCRCNMGLLAPMLQIGAATSPSLPAVLVGGGLRLWGLGSGHLAIGGGLMHGWVKDLKTLKVDDVVTGTAAIESDLGYTAEPKRGAYFVIQYKF
jgi:hypothetical protein